MSGEHFVHLSTPLVSVLLQTHHQGCEIVYIGAPLPPSVDAKTVAALTVRQEQPALAVKEIPLYTTPTIGSGFSGYPGVKLHGEQHPWGFVADQVELTAQSPQQASVRLHDSHRQLTIRQRISIDSDSGVITCSSCIDNHSQSVVDVQWLSACAVPLEQRLQHLIGLAGNWSKEFHTFSQSLQHGSYLRENRRGRTSHDCLPAVVFTQTTTTEHQGLALGCHLGWSGNHRILAERLADGRAQLQMGELLLPEEIQLAPGQSYHTPELYLSHSTQGLNHMSQQFHRFVRHNLCAGRAQHPRPVHYNTWEGLYFDHDMPILLDLVERAADIGVERFVLDDGWFTGRNDDSAGLGDWFVDSQKYPQGLMPLARAILDNGMAFGLWLEPEMVNPDSDLYRQHPDWVLAIDNNPQLNFRHQLVLDLSNQAVTDYLFECIDSLLSEYPISYLKWDMNRDLNHPGSGGRPAVHNQVRALYALLQRVREAHPKVEIESCASGGARADFGILAHTDRVWTSDNNDALQRLAIQRGFSLFFPNNLMGSHVGPRDCHITHRNLPMHLRVATALFGHMGMEMNLTELTEAERHTLKQGVKLYKQFRELLHSGDWIRLEGPDYLNNFAVVSADRDRGLFSYNVIDTYPASLPSPLHFDGLEPDYNYQVALIWPLADEGFNSNDRLLNGLPEIKHWHNQVVSGAALQHVGLQMPLLTPQHGLIISVERVN